ncbi:MAG: hypothetical protein N2047_04220, partial [Meiothermus sp.]|nr:hypothetical protein [Meiothermus sp.]
MKRLPIRPPILAVLLLGGLAAGYLILAPSGPRPAPGPSTTMASSTPPGPVETPPPPSSAE